MPDLGTELAAIPPYGVWEGNGGTYETTGVTITRPMTLEGNGSLIHDPTVTQPTVGYGTQPIIQIKNTSSVTARNLTLVGEGDGGFHADLVGEEGIRVLASDHVTLTNIETVNTWGDGLYLNGRTPVTNLVVTNFTVNGSGRMGITPANVQGALFTNVTISNTAENSWDFESDVGARGSGNISVVGGTWTNGVRIIEALNGPVHFSDCTIERHISLLFAAAASGQLVTFTGGTVLLPGNEVGITVNGPGKMVFNDVTIGRLPGQRKIAAPAWQADNGAQLTFTDCTITPPLGTNDATSRVTVTP